MYNPVMTSKASGASGEYVIHGGGVPRDIATKLAMTVNTNRMDTQRCSCRMADDQFIIVLSEIIRVIESASIRCLMDRESRRPMYQNDRWVPE